MTKNQVRWVFQGLDINGDKIWAQREVKPRTDPVVPTESELPLPPEPPHFIEGGRPGGERGPELGSPITPIDHDIRALEDKEDAAHIRWLKLTGRESEE
jgi:hypothetical protein